jgi:hypothetical protein
VVYRNADMAGSENSQGRDERPIFLPSVYRSHFYFVKLWHNPLFVLAPADLTGALEVKRACQTAESLRRIENMLATEYWGEVTPCDRP